MKSSSVFVSLASVDPDAAKQLPPGVELQVSRRTFAQIAADHFRGLDVSQASAAPSIDSTDAQVLRNVVMHRAVP